ncbi:MAG: DUF1573 domain-containing protein [Verrucomicrobia bacterium]|nr:DUF1573 domain-containing protein [Kiritimatiellia bacterium]MCO6401576.1 DUF1573 domain-containing protein [Verrucomicrobiota bacterium]
MLTRLFTALLLLGTALALTAPAQQPATTNAPHIACDEPNFDFGTADSSQTIEHTFVLKNTGTLTLEITRVQPACGCTVANISEKNIPPAGESRLTTRLSLQGRSGAQHKTILIESNDPTQPQLMLALHGTVGVPIIVQPQQIMMPRIAPGDQPTVDVTLSTGDGTAFQITSVESSSAELSAVAAPGGDGNTHRLTIALKQPLMNGNFHATVLVRTDHPKRPTVEIPVYFMVSREVIVAPRELSFDKPSEDPLSRFILVRNADGSPVELDGVEPPNASIEVKTEPFGTNGLRVQLNNLVPNGDVNGRVLRIHVRGGDIIDVPIRVQGLGT